MSPNPSREVHASRPNSRLFEYAIWILIGLTLGWFWIHEGWFQIELFYISEILSRPPHNASLASQLATVFEWKLFDGLTVRLRPMSDLVEVIDAMMRPLKLFGTHPSLTVTGILLASATVLGFYFAQVRSSSDRLRGVLLTFLFVTTVGFLSCYVPYIRPAKKLVLFCAALTLLFSHRYRDGQKSFVWLWLSVFVSFFCDEAGFALWPISMLLTGPAIIARRHWRNGMLLLSLPLFYLVMVKWAIPSAYGLFGTPRITSSDAAAYLVIFLTEPRFYWLAAQDLSASVLISLGISGPGDWQIYAGIGSIVAFLGYGMLKKDVKIVTAALGLVAMSFSLSLFDMFNSRYVSQPLGQITYYYHSPVGIFVVFALATLELRMAILFPLVILAGTANIRNFYIINRALMIEHNYPLEARSLPQHVVKPDELDREYHELILHFQGRNKSWYEKNFAYYKIHPMGDDEFVRRYNELFKPHGLTGK